MNSVEDLALQTYHKNIDYFSSQHPEVYKKLNILNLAIESGQYVERYALDYKDGYFDIQELKSGQYLYASDSGEISKQVAKQVNFSKAQNVIETFYNRNLTKQDAQKYNDILGSISDPLYATSNIIYYTSKTLPKASSSFKRIEKYIYFGVGIGEHLKLIQEKIHSSKVMIVEDDIELFRLSLFCTDYEKVFVSSKVFYSVAEDSIGFKKVYGSFALAGYNHNHYLKYTIFSDNYIGKIKQIQDIVVGSSILSHPYSMQLMNYLKTPEYLVECYKYLDISQIHESNIFSQKPVILVAAGPSLAKHIEWLKQNKDRFTLVAVLASIQTLTANDIKPDIVINIDAHQVILKFFKGVDFKKYLSDTKFIFSSLVNKKVSNIIPKENLYMFESLTNYKVGFGSLSGSSVGETSYSMLLTLGVKELYLLGLDLALNPDTMQHYANDEYNTTKLQADKPKEDIFNTQLGKTITYVKGNFLDEVPSLPLFVESIFAFSHITEHKKEESVEVYNLNNGAYLDGASPLEVEAMKLENLPCLDKQSLSYKNSIESFLSSISQDLPSKQDVQNLQDSVEEAVRLYDILKLYHEKKSFSNTQQYMLHFSKLINELIGLNKETRYDINAIMHAYIQYISPYIFDFLNTKELKNPKKHIKYINNTFVKQVGKMIRVYVDTMKIYKVFAEDKHKKSIS